MTMSLTGLTLHVADVERSLEFYRQLAGAAVVLHLPGRFAILPIGARPGICWLPAKPLTGFPKYF